MHFLSRPQERLIFPLDPSLYTRDGITYAVYVFSAQNTGTNGTGTELEGLNVTIDTQGPFNSAAGALGMDVENVSGSGASAKYTVNLDGTQRDNTPTAALQSADGYAEPVFGDIAGGTFIGVGDGVYVNSDLPDTGVQAVGGTQAVFINSQTTDYTPNGTPANYSDQTLAQLDPQFENSGTVHNGTPSTTGTVDNGTIHSLQVESLSNKGLLLQAPLANFPGGLPFANVVVPYGTNFTVHGTVSGNTGGTSSFSLSLVSEQENNLFGLYPTAPTQNQEILPAVVISPSSGPQTRTVAGAAEATGYLMVSGFSPANGEEIYGLDAVGAISLTQLINDMDVSLQPANPGAIAEAPQGSAGEILTAAGDNVELVFPAGDGSTQPVYFDYNMNNLLADGTVMITSITVLPEPGSIVLVAAGVGLLARRRRRRVISPG
jgi:hypothetical protein